jgi:DNA-binding MarR family transcriptional regulator
MDALRKIVRSLRTADAVSEAILDVSSAQLFILRELAKTEPLTIGELAQRTATAQSSVSEVVARLASKALIVRQRSAIDRRRMEVSLTQDGRSLLRRADETVQEKLLIGFSRLSHSGQALTASNLRAWVQAAGLADVEPSMFFEP